MTHKEVLDKLVEAHKAGIRNFDDLSEDLQEGIN